MFRKIVSNLSFSPALVGQLAFYAKRLRKEEATRRIGLIFVVLALIVQCLAVFSPPQSANAANDNDFIPGGLGLGSARSLNNFLVPYDQNTRHLKDVMNYMGITRQEITNTTFGYFITGNLISYGYQPRFSAAQGEKAVNITDSSGQTVTTIYGRPLKLFDGSNFKIYAYIGHSAKAGWFAIMQACGNLVMTTIPSPPTPPAPKPTPTPTPAPANIIQSKTATNVTQGNVDASTVTANTNDQISYTITAKNIGGTSIAYTLQDHLQDTLEYSTLVDPGGGTFNSSTHILSWPAVQIAPNTSQSRTFTVQVLSTIPATPQGLSDPTSYDCKMLNTFGNSVTIPVNCSSSPPKVVEQTVTELPHTGPTQNLIFGGVLLALFTYFYLRSRQVGKEVRLIRRDLHTGAL